MGGVCTAGNSSQENDAAAAFVLMDERTAKERGLEPLAYLKAWAKAADDPRNPPRAGNKAFKLVLEKAGLTIDQIDLFEIQEAFASQRLYNIKSLRIPESHYDRINVNGSGIFRAGSPSRGDIGLEGYSPGAGNEEAQCAVWDGRHTWRRWDRRGWHFRFSTLKIKSCENGKTLKRDCFKTSQTGYYK